jgi:nondiscriminating aspartyl-tRNA synthetase
MVMFRTYSADVKAGQKVVLKGWVERTKLLGNMSFLVLRDRTGTAQITAKKGDVNDRILEEIGKLGRESCVEVVGDAVESKIAKSGWEIIPESIKVVSEAEKPLPLEFSGKIESGKDTRFDYRFLDLRNPEVARIFWVRHKVIGLLHDYFRKEGFMEIHTPVIQAAGAEGGSTLFTFKYYDKQACLRQSPQLYKQMMMASGLDKVYEIGQAFRAEKFHTRRHISEFLSTDFELAWIESEGDVMKVLEHMVVHVLKELKHEGVDVKVPELPFPRIKHDEVIKILDKAGMKLELDSDLEDHHESKFGEIMAKKGVEWYFITKYPSKLRPFYIMMDGKVSRGLDLDYRGMELASGGQREHRHDVLEKVMKEKGLNPADFKFYLDAFRYGMPPHGGIGFGTERFVKQILDIPDVQETILFPRTPEKLVP